MDPANGLRGNRFACGTIPSGIKERGSIHELAMKERSAVELFIFARFHAQAGKEKDVEEAIRNVLAPTSKEVGCLSIHAFRSTRDAQLFYVHARWQDEAAFEKHIRLPHTMHFVETVEELIDHSLDVTRARQII